MAAKKKRTRLYLIGIAVIAALIGVALLWQSRPGYQIVPGFMTVQDAYRYHQTGIMAEVTGTVARVLVADKEDTRNQKFIIRLTNGQSLLVLHDQVSGDRVPVKVDDTVLVRGEYQWSETGGTLRFTQRDYSPRRMHGWIEHKGRRYD
ncbi:MAG: DUF3465 domain-containing protein [Lysobacterales bacterium]